MKNRPQTKQSLLVRFDCGPVKLSGDSNAFYERHVTFDQVVAETETTDRDKFEAIARSVRDVVSQRWLKTEQTYRQHNAKRIYYLSMEFLFGRALPTISPIFGLTRMRNNSPNITNLTRSRSSSKNRTPAWATAAWAGWRRVTCGHRVEVH